MKNTKILFLLFLTSGLFSGFKDSFSKNVVGPGKRGALNSLFVFSGIAYVFLSEFRNRVLFDRVQGLEDRSRDLGKRLSFLAYKVSDLDSHGKPSKPKIDEHKPRLPKKYD